MNNKYKMYLVLGDWSDDGHGKIDKILLESNKPVEEVQEAYRNSCKLMKIDFHDHHDGICVNYEQNSLTVEQVNVLKSFGYNDFYDENLDDSGYYLGQYEYTQLWIWFVSQSSKDLILKTIDKKDDIPNINGYWGELNEGFGYGLYH